MDRMQSVEIQARSRDEALRLALEQLNANQEDVEIEVLEETEDDYYGEGEVLIRVWLRDSGKAPSAGGRTSSGGKGQRGQRRGGRSSQQRRERPRNQQAQREQPEARRSTAVPEEQMREYEAQAKEVVRELLDMMTVPADVVAVDNPSMIALDSDDPPTVFVDINGPDLGMIIGRRGENLAQLQYMVNLLVNRRTEDWIRVIVDVEGYRTRREESLIGLAERVARQVSRNGRPISLEPMPANERRIVHLTLKDQPDVSTESSGEGSMRRVTIYPE